MLRNWFLIALRHLWRHRLYTAINVLGLAIGLSACMMIAVQVRFETGFDTFHAKAARIVRVNRTEQFADMPRWLSSITGLPVAAALATLPEVEATVRAIPSLVTVMRDGQGFQEGMLRVDPSYPRIFDVTFLKGDPSLALAQPGDAVISRSTATKFFGDGEPLGGTLTLDSGRILRVTAVMEDPPVNTAFQARLLVNIATSVSDAGDRDFRQREFSWNNSWLSTYLLLRPGTDRAAVEARLEEVLSAVVPDYVPPGDTKGRHSFTLSLQPLTDIRTNPVGGEAGTPIEVVRGLALIGLLVLLIAGINFVNMTTARASLRLREIGIRKTLGARRSGLVAQFLLESVILSLAAGILALAATELLLPFVLVTLQVTGFVDPFADPVLVAVLLLLPPLLGLVAGLYPALVLSRVAAAEGLRGAMGAGGKLRAALVVMQFAIAIILSIGALFVLAQTRFAATDRLGFDRENVLVVRGALGNRTESAADAMGDAIARLPGVLSVGMSAWAPADGSRSTSVYTVPGRDAPATLRVEPVDFGYMATLGVPLLAGRGFDPAHAADILRAGVGEEERPDANVLVSRAALPLLGVSRPEEAIGLAIRRPIVEGQTSRQVLTIVGVVEDIRFGSARGGLDATIFTVDLSQRGTMLVRLAPGDQRAMLAAIDDIRRDHDATGPIRRAFLDENIDRLYAAEARQGTVIATFAGLAVIIACLGLYGLASFTAERRTKEIGIRKVLGASVADIVRLLVWQFSRPVLVANLIAWPVAWYGVRSWLDGFAHRIDINPLLFLAVGAVALIIAWVTVAGHAARVAAEKPVRALRYE
ncbi:ABC transporter permease [Niveispirillum sp. KHB5.9]|uniref:ABC transporter permease n=1 Tax=Niveispirillum sp. KHB5.9 TaxID=3400269 RepID=UPI003A858B87